MSASTDLISALQDDLSHKAKTGAAARLLRLPAIWNALLEPSIRQQAFSTGSFSMVDSISAVKDSGSSSEHSNSALMELIAIAETMARGTEGPAASADANLSPSDWETVFTLFLCRNGDYAQLQSQYETAEAPIQQALFHARINARVFGAMEAESSPELTEQQRQFAIMEILRSGNQNLIEQVVDPAQSEPAAGQISSFQHSLRRWLDGDSAEAQALMEQAWDRVTDQAAVIADSIAVLAAENAQPIVAAQARERAAQLQPSDLRRADLAAAKLELGDVQAALQCLDSENPSTIELLAKGMLQAAQGQAAQARASLDQVDISKLPPHPIWERRWLQSLVDLGDIKPAMELLEPVLIRHPADTGIRLLAAQIYLKAGDSSSSVEQALTASMLAPDDQAVELMLAEAYSAAAMPAKALAIWAEAAQQVPGAKAKAVDAALMAEDISAALKYSQELVEDDPASASARLALGKSLIKAGNPQGGQVHIRRATELDPTNAEPWLVLSELQASQRLDEECGHTLAKAIQQCPASSKLLSAQASWLEEQNRLTEALEAAEQAGQIEDSEPAVLTQQARLLKKLDRANEARPLLEEVIRQQPANWPARIELASIYDATGQDEQALELLAGLPEDSGPEAFALLARSLIKGAEESDPASGEKALEALAKAVLQSPDDPDLKYWQGRALSISERFEEALASYQLCLKSLPEGERTLRQQCIHGQAKAALASNQVPVAISLLEKARQDGSLQPSGLALLVDAYLAAGLAEEAFEPALEVIELEPDNTGIRSTFLAACRANGQLQPALTKVEQWLAKDGQDKDLLFEKARLHIDLNQVDQARQVLAKVAWNARRSPADLDDIGQLLQAAGEHTSALRILQNADYLNPGKSDRLMRLAVAAKTAGQTEIALDSWNKILAADPNNINALVGAAEAAWQLDQRMAAIGLWQRAVSSQPKRADLHARLARAQLANGETAQALEHFRTAAELSSMEDGIQLEAAKAFMAAHHYSEALALLKSSSKGSESEPGLDHLATLAEIYLGLGSPREALATCNRSSDDQSSPRLKALAALANSRVGKLQQAQVSLDEAIAASPAEIEALKWIARAALELGQWRRAFDAARLDGSSEQLTASELSLQLEIGARLADAYTLLTDFGSVQNHAPGVETIGESVFRQLMSGVTTLAQENQPRSEVAGWQTRLKAAFGRQQPAEASALHSAVSDHAIRQQAIEGLALSKLESSDPESALRVLAEAPEPLQAGPWSALIAGIAHLQLQRPAIARKAFGSIDKGTPLWPLAAFLTGKCWRQEGRPDEAINSWNSAVLAWPEESRWQSELALVYRQQGKPEAALPHLQTALEMAPDQHDLRLPLARTLFELGDLSGAINQYLQVLPQFEQDAEVITEIGQSLLAAGQFERAYDLFLQALEVKHDHLAAEVGAAQAAWHQGEVRLAEKHSAKAIRRNPRQPDLVRSLAEIKLQAGEANQVLALIEEAYGQTDLPTDIARIKASALFERGQAQDSINLLKKIVEQDPEDDQSWAALSQAYAGANQPGQAIDALRLALNLRPGYKPYRLELARLFRRTGQLDQALEELSSLQNEEPRDHDVPLEIGLVHQSRRQLQKALTAFQRSISLNESGAAAYFQAGMVLKSLKAYPQSVEMLEKAVSINPSDSEAMHQLAAVQALQLVHGGMQTTAVSQ